MSVRIGFSLLAMLAATAALAAKPQIQWNSSYDFSTIKTFQWQDHSGDSLKESDPFLHGHIVNAIQYQLSQERADRSHRESRRVRQLHGLDAAGRELAARHVWLQLRRVRLRLGADTAMGTALPSARQPPLASSKSSAGPSSSTSGRRRARSSFGAAPLRTSACPTNRTRRVATSRRPSRRWRNNEARERGQVGSRSAHPLYAGLRFVPEAAVLEKVSYLRRDLLGPEQRDMRDRQHDVVGRSRRSAFRRRRPCRRSAPGTGRTGGRRRTGSVPRCCRPRRRRATRRSRRARERRRGSGRPIARRRASAPDAPRCGCP